jgi:hypothetical protein
MPIQNGIWYNWSFNTSNATLNTVVSTVTSNIPWVGIFFLALIYIILIILFSGEPGRKKYVAITFIGMVVSIVFGLFGIVAPAIPGICGFIFILTFIIIYATS